MLKGTAGLAALAGCATADGGPSLAQAAPASSGNAPAATGTMARPAPLPPSRGPRFVIVGGGWSGLSLARFLKAENEGFDVVLVEPSALFFSCPLSNLWLGEVIGTDLLVHSYTEAARHGGYLWLQAALVDLDRQKRRAFTTAGHVDYDFLVLAPGIDYHYPSLGVEDPVQQALLARDFPAGFRPGSEHLSLKRKLEDFEEGIFLLNVPPGNYRCYSGPYERACVIAGWMRREGIRGKVLLLDPHERPAIKAEGFLHAFETFHRDYLEYVPGSRIESVDPANRRVITEFDEYTFADAAIYPRVRAARLIEDLGLARPGSRQFEADIDPLRYNVRGDERVYVTGDARPMPFSKSANTAYTEARYVARLLAARALGKEDPPWQSPVTSCHSMVSLDPPMSIAIESRYRHNGRGEDWDFEGVKLIEEPSTGLGKANVEWGKGLYRDLFGW
jgi:hypothetical protein